MKTPFHVLLTYLLRKFPASTHSLPGVLVVQAQCNFIDSMRVRHDHIEPVLKREGEKIVSASKPKLLFLKPNKLRISDQVWQSLATL